MTQKKEYRPRVPVPVVARQSFELEREWVALADADPRLQERGLDGWQIVWVLETEKVKKGQRLAGYTIFWSRPRTARPAEAEE